MEALTRSRLGQLQFSKEVALSALAKNTNNFYCFLHVCTMHRSKACQTIIDLLSVLLFLSGDWSFFFFFFSKQWKTFGLACLYTLQCWGTRKGSQVLTARGQNVVESVGAGKSRREKKKVRERKGLRRKPSEIKGLKCSPPCAVEATSVTYLSLTITHPGPWCKDGGWWKQTSSMWFARS